MRLRHRWIRYRKLIMPILATVLVVFAILLYQNHLKNNRQTKMHFSPAIVDKSSILNMDDVAFKAHLARSSSDQLTSLALDLTDQPQEQLAVRLDRMKKRIAILNRISELDPSEQVLNFAISSKLATLMDREFIAVANDLDQVNSPTQLREFARQHLQSENIAIANAAVAAEAVAAISEYLSSDASSQRIELAKPAIERLQMAAHDTVNDVSVAKRLENWLKLVQTNSDASQSHMFVDAFVKGYGGSTNDTIAALASGIRRSSGGLGIDLVKVLDSGPANRQEVISQLMSQVDVAISQGDVPESSLLHILSRADDLLRLGWKAEAETIRQKLERSSNEQISEELSRELARFDQRAVLFDAPFDISCFTDRDSQPVQFNSADAEYRILFFGSAAHNVQAIVEFNQLLRTLRADLLSSKVELTLVYVDRNDDSEELSRMKTFAAQSERWQVWFLTATSSAGQQFLARVPLDATPYIVVLGRDNRVISLNPPIVGIKEIVLTRQQEE